MESKRTSQKVAKLKKKNCRFQRVHQFKTFMLYSKVLVLFMAMITVYLEACSCFRRWWWYT